MNLRFVILTLAVYALAACAPGRGGTKASATLTPDVSAVVGSWTAEVTANDSNVVERTFTVRDDGVTLETVCREDGKLVTVTATSPAIVTPSAITVLRTDQQFKAAGSEVCTAQVDRGVITYEIKDGALLLTPKGRSQFVFGRKDKLFPTVTSEPESKFMKFLNESGEALGTI